jgi:RNA polymerase sigma factor (sigma-70 family)
MSQSAAQDRFVSLLDEHKRILYKIAGSYCRNPSDRQDLTQEMVVALWKSFPRYDDRRPFSTWMYRVALNVAISAYRSEARRARHTVPAEPFVLEIATDSGPPDDSESLRMLHQFLERLDELDRALVILYLDGNHYDEIGEVLGISESNVGTRLGRIKQRLRRELTQTA